MTRTRKLKSAARFGARYGKKIRDLVATIESKSRAKHICPVCGRKTLKRISSGIWTCRKCGSKMAGGAYSPSTPTAGVLSKIGRFENSSVKVEKDSSKKENE